MHFTLVILGFFLMFIVHWDFFFEQPFFFLYVCSSFFLILVVPYMFWLLILCFMFFVVQLLSRIWLFATLWTAAHQASLSLTVSQNLLRLMSIESVIPSKHLILSPSSPPALNLSQHQGLFQWVGCLHQVVKYWIFSFSISPSDEYSELISFRINWFDFPAVQGTLRSLF